MFEVTFSNTNHYWCKFVFKFETLEEAQKFVQIAMSHFVAGEDEDAKNMTVYIEFKQKFTTEKEETNEN